MWQSFKAFMRATKRLKWLLISVLVIYALATPGEYIPYFPDNFAPTYEGCVLGMLQILKLLAIFASLITLFATSSNEQLLSALNQLFAPLEKLGLNTNKFTVRLMLTLNYVEAFTDKGKIQLSFKNLDQLYEESSEATSQQVIHLLHTPFTFFDKLQIVIIAGVFFMILIVSPHL